MENPRVSVIIPVYNVEKYLPRCIESVLNQSYQNLEIILIDDGSIDASGVICDKYAKMDARIRAIHSCNNGLSSARNTGTKLCGGDFVFYLDSDDYIEIKTIWLLVKTQQDNNSDIVIGNYYYTYPEHEEPAQTGEYGDRAYSKKEAIALLMQGKLQTFAWGKLIRAEIAKQHPFPVGKLFEDHFWTHLIFQDSDKIWVEAEPLVHYRQRKESISYTFDIKRLDIISGWEERMNFLNREYPELLEDYRQRCAEDAINLAWCVLTRMGKNKREGFLMIRSFLKKYQLENNRNIQTRKLVCALEKGELLYMMLAVKFRIMGV